MKRLISFSFALISLLTLVPSSYSQEHEAGNFSFGTASSIAAPEFGQFPFDPRTPISLVESPHGPVFGPVNLDELLGANSSAERSRKYVVLVDFDLKSRSLDDDALDFIFDWFIKGKPGEDFSLHSLKRKIKSEQSSKRAVTKITYLYKNTQRLKFCVELHGQKNLKAQQKIARSLSQIQNIRNGLGFYNFGFLASEAFSSCQGFENFNQVPIPSRPIASIRLVCKRPEQNHIAFTIASHLKTNAKSWSLIVAPDLPLPILSGQLDWTSDGVPVQKIRTLSHQIELFANESPSLTAYWQDLNARFYELGSSPYQCGIR